MPKGVYKRNLFTKEHKRRMSESLKGKKHSEEVKRKIGKSNSIVLKGRKLSKEHREKIKKNNGQKGKKHWQWKGGISKNKEYRSWLKNRHWIRKKNAEGSHTFGEWELLKKQYGYKCPACKRKEPEIKLTEDHIVPLSKGGSDYIENIQPLCKSCNCMKSAKIIKKYG